MYTTFSRPRTRIRVVVMKTRGSKGKRAEWDRKYYEKLRKDVGKMEERRRKEQERRKRKRIEESCSQDAQVRDEEKVKRLKMTKERILKKLEESGEIDIQESGAPQQTAEAQATKVDNDEILED